MAQYGFPPASASARLRHVEADAGVALLERRPRGVVATEAGDALAHHARLILHQQALLRGELRDFAAGTRGTLQLYANTAALTGFLPPLLAPWLATRPRLGVELKERTSVEIVGAIASGLAEAGIVSDAVAAPGLQLQPVATDHLVLIVEQEHRLAQRSATRFADILDESFVGLAPGNALYDHIDDQAAATDHALSYRIRMKSFEGLCEMVSHGVGVAVLPRAVAARHRRRYRYHIVRLTDPWALRRLCLCFDNWGRLSAPMRHLLAHLGATPNPHTANTLGSSA